MIRDCFCGPHGNEQYVSIHVYCIDNFLNVHFKAHLILCLVSACIWGFFVCVCVCFLLVFVFFHRCAKELGRAGCWWVTAELLVYMCPYAYIPVPVLLSQLSEAGALCYTVEGSSWKKPHTQCWGCARVAVLSSLQGHTQRMESLIS